MARGRDLAVLGGATDLRRLVDLTALGWAPLVPTDKGLDIGATCTVRELYAFRPPAEWSAGPLLGTSCEAFLSSFKVWNAATVGGNICMSLPAGPMITLTVALEARYELWAADGTTRTVDALDFVTGDHQNILAPGEILRRIERGNLLSSLVMSFLTMPYYVNPLLGRWLRPSPDEPAARTNLIGIGTVAVLLAFWVVVFYLVTVRIWTLP
ncbi:FAD binding domain-containing protein [Streptomyces sp. NPDC091204]|uniref:FAD binding domain-containing protein n=1 Tax=Streptomyces sp. NPDC091204 TaxID=3155299 RepID=UPI00342107C8